MSADIDHFRVLDWHHGNLRFGAARVFRFEVLFPAFKPGYVPDEAAHKEAKAVLKKTLKTMERMCSS